ncbi:PREDICTED: uncharacterized protein LOC102756272 [Myotis davidii]|uniref:uncharacterized protein LOC102756272 n=1 Tax=Myotis davidii TaxID=225400 RepID=UPI0003EC1346|nr:PREDICTED: uncharacterized protein LOC102756272 [Myotis davidii]
MSGRRVRYPNTHSHLNHPKTVSFQIPTPGLFQCPETRPNSLKRPHTPRGLEFSSGINPSEQSDSPSSPKLPVRRICMGRPYTSKFVETGHLGNRPKVAKKPCYRDSPHCLLCTDGPSDHSSPTFLEQLIRGINYLDRATNCSTVLNLPQLAINYLEQAANSYLGHPDHSSPRGYSNPSTTMMPATKGVNALQYVDDAVNTSCSHQFRSQNPPPMPPQRPEIKLPELRLFGNKLFSLGRLPKFWDEIRSDWNASLKPISKPCSWW